MAAVVDGACGNKVAALVGRQADCIAARGVTFGAVVLADAQGSDLWPGLIDFGGEPSMIRTAPLPGKSPIRLMSMASALPTEPESTSASKDNASDDRLSGPSPAAGGAMLVFIMRLQ